MTRILGKREKFLIEAMVEVTLKTTWLAIFISFTIFKYIVKGIYRITYQIYLFIKYRKCDYDINEIIETIDNCSPREFEIFCANIFKATGYRVKLTEASNDYGRDIILDSEIFVECKHYKENNYVGREICQKLVGSCSAFGITHGIVITTGTLHNNAIEYTKRINKTGNFQLDLWDKEDLIRYVKHIKVEKIPLVMNLLEN